MAAPAPAPWTWTTSGAPGANGDFNVYIVDKDGRKIAAVWGKREEKERTAALIESAPDLLAALKSIAQLQDEKIENAPAEVVLEILRLKVGVARTAIDKAEGR